MLLLIRTGTRTEPVSLSVRPPLETPNPTKPQRRGQACQASYRRSKIRTMATSRVLTAGLAVTFLALIVQPYVRSLLFAISSIISVQESQGGVHKCVLASPLFPNSALEGPPFPPSDLVVETPYNPCFRTLVQGALAFKSSLYLLL